MLSNSVIAGVVASAYLTVLVLHLNPSFPLTLDNLIPLTLVMGLAYGVNLAAVFYVLIVLRQLTAAEVLSPGWLSVRLLSWLCTIAAAAAAAIMWLNLRDYSPVLEAQTITRMTAGAVTLTASAAVFLLIALAHIGQRGGRVSAAVLTAMMAISIAAPLGARGRSVARELDSRPIVTSLAPPRRQRRELSFWPSTARRSTSSRLPWPRVACRTSGASSTPERCCIWQR